MLHVTLLSLVLGMLLAASLRTQQSITRDYGGSTRVPALVQKLRSQEQANKELEAEIAELRVRNARYERKISSGQSSSEELFDELQNLRFLVGQSPAVGPGVVVTLQDSSERPRDNAPPEELQLFMVHDSDIRNIVNELRNAGAEVVAVNGQRLTARSAIRCSGNVTMVNNTPVAAPFKVEAIGDPDTLENALKIPGGTAEQLAVLGMIKIDKSKSISINGYTGSTNFRYAKPGKGSK